jgi:peptidoglycan/xylan/chitin deacetylase (PgdA/CDA1 family)
MPSFTGTRDNHRIAVALTYDFDAESAWLGAFKVDTPSALSRGAYCATEGVPRILKLHEKYDLPATFYIPGDTADRHPDSVKAILANGHEVGHHGYLHEAPHVLEEPAEREMLERGLEALAKHGVTPVGYRSPSWELSKNTFRLLEEYGFQYDASQLAMDRPYWVMDQDRKTSLAEIPGAWELCDSAHFLFAYSPTYLVGLSAPSKVEEIWVEDFNGMYEEGGDICYVLTMHPQMIGRHHRMRMVERVVQHILGHPGVWFAQMHEIADLFRERQAAKSA